KTQLNAQALFDPSRKSVQQGKQPKQLRSGYVTASGHYFSVAKDYELKTAIDAQTGSAAESQLFGYQSIQAGQRFIFTLTLAQGLDADLSHKLQEALTGDVKLGRSRTAQFGA